MPIFHSIRGRLIAGFTLLTLLTVTLLGLLVLSLMQQYVAHQEVDYLEQNAVALARQSKHYLTASVPPPALASLAHTASLLGNFQVRILDANAEALVDSMQAPPPGQLTWLVATASEPARSSAPRSPEFASDQEALDLFFVTGDRVVPEHLAKELTASVVPDPAAPLPAAPLPPALHPLDGALPVQRMLRIIRQNRGEWGPRLHFEPATGSAIGLTTEETVFWAGDVVTHTTAAGARALTRDGGSPTVRTLPAVAGEGAFPAVGRPLRNLLLRWWSPLPRQQVTMPIQATQGVVGYVELSSTPGIAAEALAALRRLFMWAAAAVSVLAVGVGWVMSRSLTAPLQTLTEATGTMNRGDLSARATVHGNDEIGQLAQSFNRMAAALEQSFADLAAERDALRTFVADASHELRTPITALRTFNELLQEAAAGDPAAQAEFLAESGQQVQRLERITDSLLNLSRFDGGLVELELTEVPVTELLESVIALLRPLAVERSVALVVASIDGSLTVRCDQQQIERALTNLVENALKFTPEGGQVCVGATAGPASVDIWVEDTGIGIAPAEQTAIFRRFYRGQNATNGGSGLGLAIVQSIVQAHGGHVLVTSEAGQGSRFVLTL